MTDFPTRDAYFPAGAGNVGPMRTGQRNFYDAVRQMPGAQAAAALAIVAGVVTPTRAAHVIDTEAAAVADDLANIAQDNLPDGAVLVLMSTDAARVPTVKHGAGGMGQILLCGNADLALSDPSMRLILRRSGATWVEDGRSWGANVAGARAWLAAAAANHNHDGTYVNAAGQTLGAGYDMTPYNLGNVSGNLTPDVRLGAMQYGVLTGDLTILAPARDGTVVEIELMNDGTARQLLFSGYTQRPGGEYTAGGTLVHTLYIEKRGARVSVDIVPEQAA